MTRKTITLPDPVWAIIADYKEAEACDTLNEAVRRLVLAGRNAGSVKSGGARPGARTKGKADDA